MPTKTKAAKPSVFISCVSKEFGEIRSHLHETLTQDGWDVVIQPYFRQTDVDTIEKFDAYIRDCDVMVHILGKGTGSVANDRAVRDYLGKVDPDKKTFLACEPELHSGGRLAIFLTSPTRSGRFLSLFTTG